MGADERRLFTYDDCYGHDSVWFEAPGEIGNGESFLGIYFIFSILFLDGCNSNPIFFRQVLQDCGLRFYFCGVCLLSFILQSLFGGSARGIIATENTRYSICDSLKMKHKNDILPRFYFDEYDVLLFRS